MPVTIRRVVQSTIVLLTVGLLTLLAIVGMTIWLNQRAEIYFDDVIAARTTRSSAVELRSALQTAESSQRGYLLTANAIYLTPYDAAKQAVAEQLATLRKSLEPVPGSAATLQRLSSRIDEKLAEMERSIALKDDHRDADALALVRTDRGKVLTDEIDGFLAGAIRGSEARLSTGIEEQRTNAERLRWVSILGGVVIVLVVAGVIFTIGRYTSEMRLARDEVRTLAEGLEERVRTRTADLAAARDRAEVLVAEVNHRVANSLTLVASLVKLQANALGDKAAKEALDETYGRIVAIGEVHKRLYSSGDVRFVALDEYLEGLLDQLAASMHNAGLGAQLSYELEPLRLRTDASVNLGVVVTEWVTNAFKYAYPGGTGEVRVRLTALDGDRAELVVEDDGVGRSADRPAQGTGLGTRLVTAMAATLRAETAYLARTPGTAARLVFPLPAGC
jgi:two-component sensor histidine kinase